MKRAMSAWKRTCLLSVGLAASLLMAPPLGAADPVDDLRQALPIDDVNNPTDAMLQFRRDNLQKKIDALKTIGDLRRALAINEWRDDPTRGVLFNDKISPIDTDMRRQVGKRLSALLQDQAKTGDAASRQAVANLIAEMGPTVRAINPEDKGGFSRSLMPLMAILAKDKDVSVRQEALRALGNLHGNARETAQILANALANDPEAGARRVAAESVGQMVRVVSHLQKRSQTTTGVQLTPAELTEALQQAIQTAPLGFKDADARSAHACADAVHTAVQALIEQVPEPYQRKDFPPPGRALNPKEEQALQKAKSELKQEIDGLGPILLALRENVVKLAPLLGHGDAETRHAGIQALFNVALARQRLRQRWLSLPGNDLAPLADRDLLESSLPKILAATGPLLSDTDVRLRRTAAAFLLLLEDRALPLAPLLTQNLADPERSVRWIAARALANLPADKVVDAVPALAKLLAEEDVLLRVAAANTLEAMGPQARSAAGALAKAVAQGDAEGRVAAMRALTALGGESARVAVPQIIEVLGLRDADASLYVAAAQTLAQMGGHAKDAVPALRRLLGHEESEVRSAAAEAILAINAR